MSWFSQICHFFPPGFFSWAHTHLCTCTSIFHLSISPNSVSSCLNFLTSGILTQYIKKTQRITDCILQSFSVHEKIKHFQEVITLSEHSWYRICPCCNWEQKWQDTTWVSQAPLRSVTLQSITHASHSHCISWRCTDYPQKSLKYYNATIKDLWVCRIQPENHKEIASWVNFTAKTNIQGIRFFHYLQEKNHCPLHVFEIQCNE